MWSIFRRWLHRLAGPWASQTHYLPGPDLSWEMNHKMVEGSTSSATMEMPQEARRRLHWRRRRRRRALQQAHPWREEEMLSTGSDRDLELKSISFEPTMEEEEEEEDEEDELAPESSMEKEKKDFARHLANWESSFSHGRFGSDIVTSLSSMVFTHCTPSCIPPEAILCSSLQMCSIKLAKIKHLQWPLHVYGLVAARDYVDHKRIALFYRPRLLAQTLTKKNPYLHLTGPSRAIMSNEPVHIEFRLKIKGGTSRSEDRVLLTQVFKYYNPSNHDWHDSHLCNYLCKIDMCFEQLTISRQATVLAVRVAHGSPFRYGGQVICSSSPDEDDDPNRKIVLFDSNHETTAPSMDSDGAVIMDPEGYLHLSRRVVSVQGRLKFYINTYSRSGAILASGRVSFRPKDCQTSWATCFLHSRKDSKGETSKGKDEVKITVAWSRFADRLYNIERDCFMDL